MIIFFYKQRGQRRTIIESGQMWHTRARLSLLWVVKLWREWCNQMSYILKSKSSVIHIIWSYGGIIWLLPPLKLHWVLSMQERETWFTRGHWGIGNSFYTTLEYLTLPFFINQDTFHEVTNYGILIWMREERG